MFKRAKNKKDVVRRAGCLSAVFAIISVFSGFGLVPLTVPVSAQQAQSHFCEEANGKIVPSKDPCIAKKVECKSGQADDPCSDPAVQADCKSISCNALIKDYVEPGIKVLTMLMGVVVAISIVVAGIQYGSAGSDPGQVAAAKKRLSSALLALLAYLCMFSFLQWLLPGGVL